MRTAAILLVGAMVPAASGMAQTSEPAARPLAVELFSSHGVTSVTITPLGQNETLKMCAGCKAKALLKAMTVTAQGNSIELGAAALARDLEVDGAFRMQPNGGATAVDSAGVWKLRVAHGELRVVLTMDSERYVALALRGEAGAEEPLESLKAMAIAVRTFALENAERHQGEGFNLCDSTHCQVLRFGAPSGNVERAVLETAGETLWDGPRRALVFYTQNCGGESEDAAQAWPGTRAPYLKAHADPYCTRHGTTEWHAEIAVADLNRVARSAGWELPQQIDSVRVTKRTNEGRVLRLEIFGGGAAVPVTASSFRFALNRALGWNQLRSDWYSVTLHGSVLRFDGRGHGHGVGLCQAGATEMAIEGRSATDILGFYFPGTRVGVTADGGEWHATRGPGWTLWSTTQGADLARTGDAAWVRARGLYPPRGQSVEPEVWAMPTTELFRQVTREPGWMLASAQATRVFLQPLDVLSKSGREEETLLHEFLHVLVETEASSKTPLWLREGVVEALAKGESVPDPAVGIDLRKIEAVLVRPASEAESQQAHAEAARLVSALIARDGLEPVRTWVRSGNVPADALRMLTRAPETTEAAGRAPSTPR